MQKKCKFTQKLGRAGMAFNPKLPKAAQRPIKLWPQ